MSELYEVIEPEFDALIIKSAHLEKIWSNGRWCEGPVWVPSGKYVLWSDIPNNRVLRWDETDGSVSTFEEPARNQNGHTLDNLGRLVACEHQSRSVRRTGFDGRSESLATHFAGKRLNSPNDVVVKSDDTIWFTDPTYGIDSDYEGDHAPSETESNNVYRIDPAGEIECVISDLMQPNGLAFSPDESVLYVADTGQTHAADYPPQIFAYEIENNTIVAGSKRLFSTGDNGLYDGFRVDSAGRIWTSAGDGVHCISPEGKTLGKIHIPEPVANLCFCGPKLNRLFICATTSIYLIYVNAKSA